MQLRDYYQQQVEQGLIQTDPEQLAALDSFQLVFDHLLNHRKSSGLLRLRKPKAIQGLYVWGGVGIGKTLLMDCFFHCLPFTQKMRLHFHAFMQMVHQRLKEYTGQQDPLFKISRELAKQCRVICLDEFIVTDIVDAMLLARLLKSLIDLGVCFVTTSNTVPDELYKNGLQRDSFLPAIALIKSHMHVVHVRSMLDYRLQQVKRSGVFFMPDDAQSVEGMEKTFALLAHGHDLILDDLLIHDRCVQYIKRTNEVIWFDFKDICHVPRSQLDYLAIAKAYKVVFVSHVPALGLKGKNIALLFIRLIDVLYDAQIPLIFSASHPIEELFAGLRGMPETARTQSRLMEMQSDKYLAMNI